MMDKNAENICRQFTNRYGYHADFSLSKELAESFLNELNYTIRTDKNHDFAMLPLVFYSGRPDVRGKSVIVMDIGGTNTRITLVGFDENGVPKLLDFKKEPTPGNEKVIEIDEFYLEIIRIAEPFLKKADHIGVSFSYATDALPNGDAKVAAGGKQILVKDFIGSVIGEGLRKAMRSIGIDTDYKIRIINDAAAVFFGGMAKDPAEKYGNYIGLVLGTGFNMAYLEPAEHFTVVNQECGGFRRMPLNDADREYIALTYDKEIDWCEKVVSGRYFGGTVLFALRQAAKDGLFEGAFAEELMKHEALETKEMSLFMASKGREGEPARWLSKIEPEKRDLYTEMALFIAEGVMDRAAFFVSVALFATLIRGRSQEGKSTCIMVEGSLYEKLPGFAERIRAHLARLKKENPALITHDISCEFTTGENTTVFGTALAGLWE
ncbi:MAG: hypothetical protein K6F52_04375 [Clostridia bacterium]|nr:hypothetical protein [Clostridia bacterium]